MRRPRALQALSIAAFTVLVPWGVNHVTDTTAGDLAETKLESEVVKSDVGSCAATGDVFLLDVPGTYTAFAVNRSGSLLTEVRASGGDVLATSHQTRVTTRAVDLPSGLRFGVAAPQVFEVKSEVTIHVHHENSTYELLLVHFGETPEFSRFDVRPPVERIADESGSCPDGGGPETFKVHIDAVYFDTVARQVFVVDSPSSSPIAEGPTFDSADPDYSLRMAWRSLARGHGLFTSSFFIGR